MPRSAWRPDPSRQYPARLTGGLGASIFPVKSPTTGFSLSRRARRPWGVCRVFTGHPKRVRGCLHVWIIGPSFQLVQLVLCSSSLEPNLASWLPALYVQAGGCTGPVQRSPCTSRPRMPTWMPKVCKLSLTKQPCRGLGGPNP